MEQNTHVAQYLERLNYTADLQPTLAVLAELQKANLTHIPFENLDVYNRKKFDLTHLFDKIITQKRGGFCYELNWPFHKLLLALGFQSKVASARVLDPVNGYGAEFDHMVIIVTIEGADYLVDVGFGEFSLYPIKIELNAVHTDPRGTFKIEAYDEHYKVVKRKTEDGDFTPIYIFSEIARQLDEFNGMCNYHQTSDQSLFTQKRLCTMLVDGGRITLTNNTLKSTIDGVVTERQLENEDEVKQLLLDKFNIIL